jgi:hypothetical protein
MGAFDDLVPGGKSAGAFDDLVPSKKKEKIDPTEGMSFLDNLAAGTGKGIVDTYRGAKQLFNIGDQKALQAEIDESKRLDAPLMETGGGVTGAIAGNVASTLIPGMGIAKGAMAAPKVAALVQTLTAARPVASGIAAGVGSGAVSGALEPTATGESRGKNMATGAAFGAAGGAIPGVLAKVAGGAKVDDAARMLMDEGVSLTPGQAMGGVWKSIEEKATSIPVVGSVIKRAQTRGLEDFNRAGFNRALAPIGEKVGKDFNIGHEGIAAVEAKIGAAYDKALDNIKIVNLDNTFGDEVGKVLGMAAELGEGPAKQLTAILKNRVIDKMTPAGTMSAETMKEVESTLGREAAKWRGSADAAQRGLGDALREVQSSLRGAVERSAGPEAAQQLRNANEAWANFVRIRDAGSRVGAKEGMFTPAQLNSAARSGDKSVGKGSFAKGGALMQDLAEAGKSTIAQTVPDSGTAGRLANMGAIGALPFLDPSTLAMAGAAALPYSRMGGNTQAGRSCRRSGVGADGSVTCWATVGSSAVVPASSASTCS